MTTKKNAPKTKRRAPKSSAKPKRRQPKGELAKFPMSPIRAAAIMMYENQMADERKFADQYAPLADGPRFEFENEVNFNKIPAKAWDAFLSDLEETGNITKSCVRIGIKRITVYKRAENNEEFAKALKAAHQTGLARLEDVAVQRATEGVDKPVFFQGEIVGFTREYSDQLLQFLLKGNMKKYREAAKEEETPRGSGVLVVPASLDAGDWEAAAIVMQKSLREDVRK